MMIVRALHLSSSTIRMLITAYLLGAATVTLMWLSYSMGKKEAEGVE